MSSGDFMSEDLFTRCPSFVRYIILEEYPHFKRVVVRCLHSIEASRCLQACLYVHVKISAVCRLHVTTPGVLIPCPGVSIYENF